MKLSAKLLGQDERIVLHVRTHIKAILPNLLAGLVALVLAILGWVYMPDSWKPAGPIAMGVAFLLIFGFLTLWPWLNWLTATYTVTNRRLITRRGVLTKNGHDIPLSRISNVEYEHSFTDRLLGCGTLVLQTSAVDPLVLDDVPHVERVHVTLANLLFNTSEDDDAEENLHEKL